MFSYVHALSSAYPGVLFSAIGDGSNYDDITWIGGDPMPTQIELEDAILTETRISVWTVIKAERDRRQANGVKVTWQGTDYWFHSDNGSRIQQIALVIFGSNLPSNIMWKTLGGSFVEMTPALAQAIFSASVIQDMAIFTVAETHKAQMMASLTPAEYDFSTGWPPTYTGSVLL